MGLKEARKRNEKESGFQTTLLDRLNYCAARTAITAMESVRKEAQELAFKIWLLR